MSKKIIHVVAAAIEKDGKIFCAQRPEGKSLGGFWEFPGGKLEAGESPEQALIREIQEELNSEIEIISFGVLTTLSFLKVTWRDRFS